MLERMGIAMLAPWPSTQEEAWSGLDFKTLTNRQKQHINAALNGKHATKNSDVAALQWHAMGLKGARGSWQATAGHQ